MKTSEVEIETGISKQTLHFYEAEGLVQVQRDQNGYRNYSENNVQTLNMIRLLRNLEVSIDDIRQFLVGSLPIESVLSLKQQNLEKQIKTQQDILDVVSVLKQRKIPIMLPFDQLAREIESTQIGYWRTSNQVSIGRRLTRASLLRLFFLYLLNSFVLTCALMIGIPKMVKRSVPGWVYALIFFVILGGAVLFFLMDLTTTGSPVASSRLKVVEFEREGIYYYNPKGILQTVQYVLNALRGYPEKSLKFVPYEDIVGLKIKCQKRYMRARLAIDVKSLDFDFEFKDGERLYLLAPLLLDDDSYWLAQIIHHKVANVDDRDGLLTDLILGKNINERV